MHAKHDVKIVLTREQSKGNQMKINVRILYNALREPAKLKKKKNWSPGAEQ